MNLLYVCDCNVERSPAAEIITKTIATQAGLELTVSSAGLYKSTSYWMKTEMGIALAQLKYPNTKHTPKKIKPEIIAQQDLILCFEKRQKKLLTEIAPGKPVFTLPEYASWFSKDIKDIGDYIITPEPTSELKERLTTAYIWLTNKTDSRIYEHVIDRYVKTAKTIEKHVNSLIKKLMKTNNSQQPSRQRASSQ